MEKQNLEEELQEVRQQEEHMCGANRALTRHLEDTQVTCLTVCLSLYPHMSFKNCVFFSKNKN